MIVCKADWSLHLAGCSDGRGDRLGEKRSREDLALMRHIISLLLSRVPCRALRQSFVQIREFRATLFAIIYLRMEDVVRRACISLWPNRGYLYMLCS
jgi:hypothetical protein